MEKHWRGAAPTTAMTHIAIQEQLDGKAGFLFLAKASPLFWRFLLRKRLWTGWKKSAAGDIRDDKNGCVFEQPR